MKWEYMLVHGNFFDGQEKFLARLNELGKEGWEAVGYSELPAHSYSLPVSALLKRAL